MRQTIRDVVTGELSLEYFAKRFSEGWKVGNIEWVRETFETDALSEPVTLFQGQTALPYGFEITGAGRIQESPLETAVLLLILDQIVRERRITEIAAELNQHGYSTREGSQWCPTDVFNLLPRLIETGPALLKSAAWQQRRAAIQESAAERRM